MRDRLIERGALQQCISHFGIEVTTFTLLDFVEDPLKAQRLPLDCFTIPYAVALKMWACVSRLIPHPVSLTARHDVRAGRQTRSYASGFWSRERH
ncbi:MAG: hypothetical protein ACR2G6_07575 [Gemmatimonadaceae bacterium]